MKHPAPLRWSDEVDSDAPEGIRAMLSEARSDGPSAAQLERLIASVSSPAATAWPASPSALSLWIKGGLVALVVVGLGAWLSGRAPAPQPARSEPPAMPAPQLVPAPAPVITGPAPEVPIEAPVAPARSAKPKPAPRATTQEINAAGDDIVLLQRAKRALPASPARSLALLAEHARDFPESAFTEEREALSIEAQLKTGRRERARAQLELFKTRYPRSAYLRRLEGLPFTSSTRK